MSTDTNKYVYIVKFFTSDTTASQTECYVFETEEKAVKYILGDMNDIKSWAKEHNTEYEELEPTPNGRDMEYVIVYSSMDCWYEWDLRKVILK